MGSTKISEQIMWKLLELTFVLDFLKNDENLLWGQNNILTTKCVFQIVSDVLKEF